MNSFIIKDSLNFLTENNISYTFLGNKDIEINYAKKFSEIEPHTVAFYRDRTNIEIIGNVNDCLLILHSDVDKDILPDSNYIFCDNPDLCFCVVASLLINNHEALIHPSAVISKSAQIGQNVSVGPFSIIGDNVVIGNNVRIESHVVIENSIIGNDVVVSTSVKIGSSGLGSHKSAYGKWFDFPHFGLVIIGDNVNILDNTVICRGTLNNTVIKSNVRIAGSVYISHGVFCDEGVFIASGVTIAGSVRIGKNSYIWINSSIRDQVTIGRNVTIGMGSVVTKNVPDNEMWVGNPARCIKLKD